MSSPTDSTDRPNLSDRDGAGNPALDVARYCGSPWCDKEISPDGAMCSPECLQDWRDWQPWLLAGSDV